MEIGIAQYNVLQLCGWHPHSHAMIGSLVRLDMEGGHCPITFWTEHSDST